MGGWLDKLKIFTICFSMQSSTCSKHSKSHICSCPWPLKGSQVQWMNYGMHNKSWMYYSHGLVRVQTLFRAPETFWITLWFKRRMSQKHQFWLKCQKSQHESDATPDIRLAHGVHNGQAGKGFFFFFYSLWVRVHHLQLKEAWSEMSRRGKSPQSSSRLFLSQLYYDIMIYSKKDLVS